MRDEIWIGMQQFYLARQPKAQASPSCARAMSSSSTTAQAQDVCCFHNSQGKVLDFTFHSIQGLLGARAQEVCCFHNARDAGCPMS
eukprot:scaffold47370_cov71-Cyclotella_meneghiniana.AAC.3